MKKKKYTLPVNYTTLHWNEKWKVRNQYREQQKDKCMYCHEPLTEPTTKEILNKKINLDLFPPDFLKHPVHLQHCHKTGMTEGVVHAYCNAVLWQYEGR